MTETEIDQQLFRNVLGHYPTGVVIVTGVHPDGELLAMIVGTFTSVSLDPPLVAFLPMKTSGTFARLQECPSLCINVLTGKQEAVGRTIAGRRQNKFEGLEHFASTAGNPVLADSLAWIDVTLIDTIDAGDHWIAMCRVTDLAVTNPVAPLIFFQGGYGRFVVPSLVARIEHDITDAVTDAVAARPTLEHLAERYDCEASLITMVNADELATIASAVGPGARPSESLGQRIPVVPPIADVYMAETTEAEQEAWLARAKGAGEDFLRTCRERLTFARENGYLMSFLPAGEVDAYGSVAAATQQYARGEVTPAVERDILNKITLSHINYDAAPVPEDEESHLGMIVAVIHDTEGQPVHMLRMSQFPVPISGDQAQERIHALLTAVAELEQILFEN